MRIGALRIVLLVPEARSLKAKRSPLKGLITRLRDRFNASVAEVADHDLHQRATLGVAVVAADGVHLDQQLAAVLDFVHQNPDLPVLDARRETFGGPA